jgi:two-component system, NarL family, response regulator LiaR
MNRKIKIIIADDHPLVVEGLVNYLSTNTEIEVLATTSSLNNVMKLVTDLLPDIIFIDYHFAHEELTGLDICKQVVANCPEAKVIVISSYADVELVKDFIDAGARGFLHKTATRSEFIDAIHQVFAGGEFFGKEIRDILVKIKLHNKEALHIKFTKAEEEIIRLIIQGNSTRDIAKKTSREKSTIDSHRKSILSKFYLMDSENTNPSKNILYYVTKFNLLSKFKN